MALPTENWQSKSMDCAGLAGIHIGECLAGRVLHDIAAGNSFAANHYLPESRQEGADPTPQTKSPARDGAEFAIWRLPIRTVIIDARGAYTMVKRAKILLGWSPVDASAVRMTAGHKPSADRVPVKASTPCT